MSVYKRGGVYCYDFWFRRQRYRQCTGLTNKTAALSAEAIRKAQLAEGRAGIVRRQPSVTFESFVITEFFPWSEKMHETHPNTHKRYRVSSKPLIAVFGDIPVDRITAAQVEKFKLTRANEISAAGTNRDLAALRVMLNLAIRQKYLQQNPVCEVKFLPEGPGCMRTVSHEEQQRYLSVAHPVLQDVALLILETEMRPREVYTMRFDNVHLVKRFLFVPDGKTRFARRNIPLSEAAIEVLRRRTSSRKSAYVFPHRDDPQRPLAAVQKWHDAALRKTKISPKFRLYDLRHTFGSRAAMAGVDLATLKELMGHSNVSTTMRYVHPTPEHKRGAVEKLRRYNAEQVFALFERPESPQKSPHCYNENSASH